MESQTKKNDRALGQMLIICLNVKIGMSIIGNRNTETFLKRQMGEVAKLGAFNMMS